MFFQLMAAGHRGVMATATATAVPDSPSNGDNATIPARWEEGRTARGRNFKRRSATGETALVGEIYSYFILGQ